MGARERGCKAPLLRSGGLAFKLSFWSGVEVVRCRRSSVFAWGPVRRLILHPAKSSGTLGLFLKARLLWFRLLYGCRSAVVVVCGRRIVSGLGRL